MKQILHKLRVLLLIVWGMCIPSLPGYAMTDSEFATWTGVRVDWLLNPRVKFRGTFQTRTQNGLKEMERGRLNVGLNYRVLPLMQLKGYYEIQYRDRGTAGWKVGHRYQAGFIVSGAKRNIKLGWRELLQHTFIGGANEVQLRSRLRVAYEPENWIAYPYFFVETFQPLGDEAFFSLPRVRYRPGVRCPLSRKTALDVYYCRQYDVKRCQNILGFNLEIKL